MLRERGYPDELLHAVQAHYAARTGVEPVTRLDRTLHACDEITGLVTAAALVRPSRSVMDLEARSVLKKMKDRQFAAGVDREDVRHAAEELGVDLAEHVDFVIHAMRSIAPELGLAGTAVNLHFADCPRCRVSRVLPARRPVTKFVFRRLIPQCVSESLQPTQPAILLHACRMRCSCTALAPRLSSRGTGR